ncbi:MAG: 4-hydroxybenzoate octaprenyltransferase [Plesiomonas sp.]|uniref:4-hydroxybenzoate octaprenyltransferase n=1 Tax=Plesiomonas sp. TaxID=2486279 RepID=UPI003F36C3A4
MFREKLSAYWCLMRMDRPIGTLLLLWPTLWALWLAADGQPTLPILLVFVFGVIVMRAAGCVINDYADRKVDGHVKRTATRPLPSGLIKPKEARWLFVGLIFVALLLVLTLNTLTILLSMAALVLAFIYPFMKRFTHLPQVVLGVAFGWSIPMAFAAQINVLPPSCWLLLLANICWTVAYDTQYAMVDRDDDLLIGVKSTAILFGRFDTLIIGLLQLATLVLLVLVGMVSQLGMLYYSAILLSAGLFIYQQQLLKARDRRAYFQAFLNNNYVGMVLFVGIAASYLLH